MCLCVCVHVCARACWFVSWQWVVSPCCAFWLDENIKRPLWLIAECVCVCMYVCVCVCMFWSVCLSVCLSLCLSVSSKWIMIHTNSRCFYINQSSLLFRKILSVSDDIALSECRFESSKLSIFYIFFGYWGNAYRWCILFTNTLLFSFLSQHIHSVYKRVLVQFYWSDRARQLLLILDKYWYI